MNRNELRKCGGKTFKFVPPPRRDSANGSWESQINLWILRRETDDGKGFEFLNAISDHDPLILDGAQIRHFDAPNNLVLRGQIILQDKAVVFEPFHPKPFSAGHPVGNLCLSIDGADPDGSRVVSSPPIQILAFMVTNMGEQSVRDFRTTLLIPLAFRETSSESYPGKLSQIGMPEIDDRTYRDYGRFIQSPIYQKESICVGTLHLSATPGDYKILWRIHCDDGVFPTDKAYGEIKLHVIPLSDLMNSAVDDLYKPS